MTEDRTDHPIFEAARMEDLSEVKRHIADGADVDVRTSIKETPLIWAASFGYLDIVEYLAENGADIDAQYDAGNTPLIATDCRVDGGDSASRSVQRCHRRRGTRC